MDGKSMRYNHESYLPIGSFQPILGRMALHGGGGGGVLDTFSDIIGTGGGDTGLLNVIDEGVQAAGSGLAEVDDFVNEEIPGGWLLPAAIAIAVATGYVDPTLFAAEAGTAGTAGLTAAESAALAESAAFVDSAMVGAEGLVQGSGLGAGAFTSAIPEYPMTVTPEVISKTAAETLASVPKAVESYQFLDPNLIDVAPVKEPFLNPNLIDVAPERLATKFLDNPVDYLTQKATGAADYLTNRPLSEMPGDLYGAAKDYYNTSSKLDLARDAATAYGLANIVGSSPEQGKSQAQIDEEEEAKRVYTYGISTPSGSNYIPKNRVNAGNVYSPTAGYRPLNRYADGGEVQHYGIGGRISDAFTRVAQPFEKAVLRPIGEAAPFLKDLAPYAGIAAGAMMGNPYVGGAVGGIASGFGKPGGFDFKRAFMGGVASYGMSNLMSGLEAAGTPESALPFYPEAPIQPSGIVGSDTMFVPQGPSQAALQSMAKTDLANAPRDIFSIRNPEAIQKGIGNLLQNSNTPAYKDAMAALTNKTTGINMYNTGLPLIMGTTGIMGVDESNELKKQYDSSLMAQQGEEAAFNARVAAGKKRAQQAVSENPYRFAMGGAIDDEYGGDNMNTVNGNMQNGFMGYADGGPVTNAEDLEFMTQLENNRNEVDPMSDSRYAGLLKQNQDYLSTIYGNIYNQPTPQPVAPPAAVAPSVEPTPLTGAVAPPPPPPPPPTVAPLDIETVRANANRALDMSEEVQNNVRDSSRAVEKAQALIGTASATPPPPVYQSPNATPAGQYMVRNPYGPEPLNATNIYQYQKKKQRGYAEGGIPRFLSGGGDGMSDSIKAKIEGTQEARLADGEFVIPADVVSHLGNGSSKAGAKQLYDMMDRVRKARTGNRKQGREIKPTKLMPV